MKVVTISSWLNFGRPATPGRGSAAGQKNLTPPYYSQRAVFASLPSIFHILLVYFCSTVSTTVMLNVHNMYIIELLLSLNVFLSFCIIISETWTLWEMVCCIVNIVTNTHAHTPFYFQDSLGKPVPECQTILDLTAAWDDEGGIGTSVHGSFASWKVLKCSPFFKCLESSVNQCRFWKVLEIWCQGRGTFLNLLFFKFDKFALRFVCVQLKELRNVA